MATNQNTSDKTIILEIKTSKSILNTLNMVIIQNTTKRTKILEPKT